MNEYSNAISAIVQPFPGQNFSWILVVAKVTSLFIWFGTLIDVEFAPFVGQESISLTRLNSEWPCGFSWFSSCFLSCLVAPVEGLLSFLGYRSAEATVGKRKTGHLCCWGRRGFL